MRSKADCKTAKRKYVITLPAKDELSNEALMKHLTESAKQFSEFCWKAYIVSGWKKSCARCNDKFYPTTKSNSLCEKCLDSVRNKTSSEYKSEVKPF